MDISSLLTTQLMLILNKNEAFTAKENNQVGGYWWLAAKGVLKVYTC